MLLRVLCISVLFLFATSEIHASDTTYITKKMVVGKREISMNSTFKVTGEKIIWTAPALSPESPEKIVNYSIRNSSKDKDASGETVLVYLVTEVGTNEESKIEIKPTQHTLTNIAKLNGAEFKVVFSIE